MDKKEFESPLKKHFDAFDVEHFDWTANDYKAHAIKQQVNLNAKLIEDWKWRYKVGQNVITSAHGQQGSGKSLFALQCMRGLYLYRFGKPPEDDEIIKHTVFKAKDFMQKMNNPKLKKKETWV